MVAFDPVVGVLLGVVSGVGQQVGDVVRQGRGAVGDDLVGVTVPERSGREERPCCGVAAALRDEHVYDLAVFIAGPVHVSPDASDLDVGLVDEPALSHDMAARAGYVYEQQREAFHLPKQGDVIDLDAALREEFVEVAVRQTEAEIPADGQHNHLRREPEPRKRRQRLYGRCGTTAKRHYRTLTDGLRSVNATASAGAEGVR